MLLWYMVSNDVRHSCCEFSAKGGRDFIAVRQLATRDVKFYWQVLPCLNSALDGGWMDSNTSGNLAHNFSTTAD